MLTSLDFLQQVDVKKLPKIYNFDEESLHIFRTTCWISMKYLEKMYLRIIFKVTKNHGFTLFLKKHQGDYPNLFRVRAISDFTYYKTNLFILPRCVYWTLTRSSQRRCSGKKLFLNISQNSQKTPALESLFRIVKLQVWR